MGSGNVCILAKLPYLVGTHSGYDDLKSGNEQDAIEFFILLFQQLPSSYIECFAMEENVEVKLVIDGKHVPCPNCGTSRIKLSVKDNIIHLTLHGVHVTLS